VRTCRHSRGRGRRGPFRRLVGGMLACCLLAGGGSLATAADTGDLGTDRDAFTPNVETVAAGHWLGELSYVYIDNVTGAPTNNFPEILLRRGMGERFELRLGFNYGVGSQGNVVTNVEAGEGAAEGGTVRESSLLYGFKIDLVKQRGWLPQSCFIMEAFTPTSGEVFGTTPVATLVAGWELPVNVGGHVEPWRLDGGLRYAYAESPVTWFDRWSPSVVLRMPLNDRWEVHAEWFASYTQGLPEDTQRPFFSPGVHYDFAKNVGIGLRFGWGLSAAAAPFFSDVGMAVRW